MMERSEVAAINGGLADTSDNPRQSGEEFLWPDYLPPDHMWAVERKEDYRDSIPTPVDAHGLIDVNSLITTVKSLIKPEYEWPRRTSRHHLYWTEESYREFNERFPSSRAIAFRELPINIGLMPRQFENVIHYVTQPALVPDPYVMGMRVEAWRVAHNLFQNAREAVQLERKARRRAVFLAKHPQVLKPEFNGEDVIGKEIVAEMFSRYFRGMNQHFEALEDLPTEFHIVNREATPVSIATNLGKIIGNRSLPLINKVRAA
ncbi:MAG TPA: hypothetical protein VG992_02265 [Candidatus Saccharimonadales bacterium]|nr:hypothetical protein [Candidatus Saccharimonadales bacterium]